MTNIGPLVMYFDYYIGGAEWSVIQGDCGFTALPSLAISKINADPTPLLLRRCQQTHWSTGIGGNSRPSKLDDGWPESGGMKF